MLSIGLELLELFVAFGIYQTFNRNSHAGLLQKFHFYGIAVLSFISNRELLVVLT